ncbi:MAG: nucleotidyltransferase family protein [Coriobacteriaceae bacterium]|nr:nucleotidyltransferase family protein [Coriobacteriaceae bacterium]
MSEASVLSVLLDFVANAPDDRIYDSAVFQAMQHEGLISRFYHDETLNSTSPLDKEISYLLNSSQRVSQRQFSSLERFSQEAHTLSLDFCILKGIPLSEKLYGSMYVRESKDIDLLVAQDDVGKAHRAALQAGFLQPIESFRARQLASKGVLDEKLLQGMASPYPIRNSSHAPHLAPYMRFEEDGSPTILEIHDAYIGMPDSLVRQALLDSRCMNIDGVSCPVPTAPFSFIFLLLAAHEATEGFRANVSDGSLGLKYLMDIKRLLESDPPLRIVSKIAEEYGLWRILGETLYDFVQVYPDMEEVLKKHFPFYESQWGLTYKDRLLDIRSRHRGVANTIGTVIRRKASRVDVAASAMMYLDSVEKNQPLLRACIADASNMSEVCISWHVSEAFLEKEGERILLHSLILWSCRFEDCQSCGLAMTVFRDENQWHARAKVLQLAELDYHVNKHFGEDRTNELGVSTKNESVSLDLSVRIPEGISLDDVFVCHSVYKKEIAGLYKPIAGETCQDILFQCPGVLHEGPE